MAAGAGLLIATLAVYANTLHAPFVLDDPFSIANNPTLRHPWRLWEVLAPPGGGTTVSGRPLLNLSLALNYAVSGLDPWSYHALNALLHALAGLALFGLVRRTLARAPGIPDRLRSAALPLALATAALWALHPLQTEAVTYTVQRAESMMGLFFLLTLYCVARASESPRPGRWEAAAIAACACGMATKEVMVAAPVLALLYDRTFAAGSFAEAWRRRRRLHLGLAATWLLLAALVASTGGNRSGSIGFGVKAPWGAYLLSQFPAIARYLRLSFWPGSLTFDYGFNWSELSAGAIPPAAVVLLLGAGTIFALQRRPAAGFLGAWFFAILAPTSFVPGTTQIIVEHRMYLPLAAVAALSSCTAWALLGRRSLPLLAAAAAVLGWLTLERNRVYRTELSLWSDTVAKSPASILGHNNLGHALFQAGRNEEAQREFEAVLALNPGYPEGHYNFGSALLEQGRPAEAIAPFQEALRLLPSYANAHNNLGSALYQTGRADEAMREYGEAIRLNPDHPKAHYNLALALIDRNRLPEAASQLEESLRVTPDDIKAHNNLGNVLLQIGRTAEAVQQYREALRLDPSYANAHNNLGTVLRQQGRIEEAIEQHEIAARLQPDSADLHFNLGNVLAAAGRRAEAIEQYRTAVRLRPDHADAREMLRRLLEPPPDGGSSR